MKTSDDVAVTCPACSQAYRVPATTRRASAPCKRCGYEIELRPAVVEASAAEAAAGSESPPAERKPADREGAAVNAIRARSARAARAMGRRPSRRP